PSPSTSAGEQPTSSAPPALAAPTISARRVAVSSFPGAFMSAALGGDAGGVLDRRADALVGAAAADVAAHGEVDVGVGRLGRLRQEGRRAHDLTGLAVPA